MTLHLLHLPVDVPRLMACGREHGLVGTTKAVDLGYLVHSLFARTLGEKTAQPFDIQPRPSVGHAHVSDGHTSDGRQISVLAYAAEALAIVHDRARRDGEAGTLEAIAWEQAGSKPMPDLAAGQRVGFRVRVCPTVRIGKHHPVFAHGAEIDPYLALVKRGSEAPGCLPTREAVYRAWLQARIGPAASLDTVVLTELRDARLWRKGAPGEGARSRMHGHDRPTFNGRAMVGRRDAVFEGTLRVADPGAFQALLARGVGRHRAFGFGMLLLRPADR